jgi:hypothetical protein
VKPASDMEIQFQSSVVLDRVLRDYIHISFKSLPDVSYDKLI